MLGTQDWKEKKNEFFTNYERFRAVSARMTIVVYYQRVGPVFIDDCRYFLAVSAMHSDLIS